MNCFIVVSVLKFSLDSSLTSFPSCAAEWLENKVGVFSEGISPVTGGKFQQAAVLYN